MAYYVTDNFAAGVDVRAPAFNADPGTLSRGVDVHLTQTGHIEVRKNFTLLATLPANTHGLAALRDQIYVFGSAAAPVGLPSGFFYQRLVHPNGAVMSKLIDVELFSGKFYAVAAYTSDIVHFHDAVRVADWQISTEVADPAKFIGGGAVRTIGEKVYTVDGSNLHFSKIADPLHWQTTDTGAGFIDMSTHSTGADDLVGIELYYDSLAVFARESVQLWHVEADEAQNARIQTLRGTGLVGPKAVTSYLDGDTMFLSYQGVKAVQPKDRSSGRSLTNDVSAAIDTDLLPFLATLPQATLDKARMLVEPESNRLWVCVSDRIYVLNWFPTRKVKGWTEYRPGFVIDAACVCNRRVYLRSGDNVYLYGGAANDEYFAGEATVRLPYSSLRAPATFKAPRAFDAGVEGVWDVYLGQRPDEPDLLERIGIVQGQTFDEPACPVTGEGTHFSFELRHTGDEYARLSSVAIHYKTHEAG